MKKRIAICITGGSGTIYAYRMLQATSKIKELETHVVVTNPGLLVMKQEVDVGKAELAKLSTYLYDDKNFMAPIASGSFRLDGVAIVPCSMKTLAGIAMGYDDNLVSRVASVALKERWRLILMTRETPLNTIQLRNMVTVSEVGAIIMPPQPPLYFGTNRLEELIDITIGRVLTMLGIENDLNREWGVKEEWV